MFMAQSDWKQGYGKDMNGDSIYFAEFGGRSGIVSFKRIADYLINDTWYGNKRVELKVKLKELLPSLLNLYLEELEQQHMIDSYPSDKRPTKVLNKDRIALQPLKQTSSGQVIIITACSWSSLSPVLFGMWVESVHVFGDDYWTDWDSGLDHTKSHAVYRLWKMKLFQVCLVRTDLAHLYSCPDNVDHCQESSWLRGYPWNGIPIHQYIPEQALGLRLYFRSIPELTSPTIFSPGMDLLWHTSLFFSKRNCPSWSELMSDTCWDISRQVWSIFLR